MKLYSLLFFVASLIVFTTACQRVEQPTTAQQDSNAKRYELKGTVISVDAAKREATIQHEDVFDNNKTLYMKAMTMPLTIKQDWVLRELKTGDKIGAELVIERDGSYLDNVGISAALRDNQGNAEKPREVAEDKVGQEVPDFKLTNQDGKRIGLKQFQGKTLVLTFIYTRCPLPDFCPRMSLNMSDLEKQVRQTAALKDQTQLLSITFDPKYDTPEVLRKYGIGYFGNDAQPSFDIWQLATGSEKEIKEVAGFFGLKETPDGKEFIHNLRTAIVKPDGKIYKIYSGSTWTPETILQDLQALSANQ